jgi:hypothetical protein
MAHDRLASFLREKDDFWKIGQPRGHPNLEAKLLDPMPQSGNGRPNRATGHLLLLRFDTLVQDTSYRLARRHRSPNCKLRALLPCDPRMPREWKTIGKKTRAVAEKGRRAKQSADAATSRSPHLPQRRQEQLHLGATLFSRFISTLTP